MKVNLNRMSYDLCDLTELLDSKGHEAQHGVLGGEWGYGAEYTSTVFEMHPFWWGDCTCGFEQLECEWLDAHPHADDCYQSELERRDYQSPEVLAKEWGIPRLGCFCHCTCGQEQEYVAWHRENAHDPACPEVRPNFRHFESGLEVRWYKYIGRDMELSFTPDREEWNRIIGECFSDVESRPCDR